jgi:pimeloyl-ACP methyl ester carboxylesterase
MGPLVTALKEEGYVGGETLFGAPYDFRYAPGPYAADVAIKYSEDLKRLIEQAYAINSNKSVVLVAHSLGGLWALYFLNQQPLSWRKQYIKSFVSISAPWGGTVQEMLTFASGYSEGIYLIDPLTLRAEQRSSETNMWLLPTPKVFGKQPLVLTNTRLYTSHDLEDFLKDIGYPEGVNAYRTRIPHLINNLTAPGIPVSIIHGHGVKTPERLFYYEGFDRQPAVMEGDGDGTVNIGSLEAVVPDWTAVDGQQIRTIMVGNCTHSTIIMEAESIKSVIQEILFDWTEDAQSRQ